MEVPPIYINPEQTPDINNVRLRHSKSNPSTQVISQPEHIVLNADDFSSTESEVEPSVRSKYRHKKSQILFLILTAVLYVLHALRSFISEDLQASSPFWSSLKPAELTRIYTSELRSDSHIEYVLIRFAEISQALCCIYMLTFILRFTHLGYLYRNPNIFNRTFCLLMIFAVGCQILSQTLLPPEIDSACLLISLILLSISCCLIANKLVLYEEKLKTIDQRINRYFILNILFLYTTYVIYIAICSSIECFAFHLDLANSTLTTIGYSIVLFIIILYSYLDQFHYSIEFQSVYSPYLFFIVAFHCLNIDQTNIVDNHWNYYYRWVIFISLIMIVLVRLTRQIRRFKQEKKIKYAHQTSLEEKSVENN